MTVKTAYVTGASRGIGAAIATMLAKDGFHVVGTATTEKGAESIRTMLQAHGGSGAILKLGEEDTRAQMEAMRAQSSLCL